ncbi:hypothetical protein ACFQJ3_05810 [Salinibaculum sp. GCM10025337]
MQPRSLFDGVLVATLGAIVYVRLLAPSFQWGRLRTVSEALTSLDVAFYLVFAGILTLVALIYMFVYLPEHQSQNPPQ